MVLESDYSVKTLLIGDSGVGKSCLMKKFVEDKFDPSFQCTIGVDHKIIYTNIDNKVVKLLIWDTAGQERFKTITKTYYRGANAVIFVYDSTDRFSFSNIPNWLKEFESNISVNEVIKILVGTKSDIKSKRQVSFQEGYDMSNTLGFDGFFETSSKTNSNVEETFLSISNLAISKGFGQTQTQKKQNSIDSISIESNYNKKNNKKIFDFNKFCLC